MYKSNQWYVNMHDLLFAEKSEMLHGVMHLSRQPRCFVTGEEGCTNIAYEVSEKNRSEFELLINTTSESRGKWTERTFQWIYVLLL